MGKRGMFIVFEGIDGAGTSTQILNLAKHIMKLNKYHKVLLTHEPTGSATQIQEKLAKDADSFSDAETMAKLYIEDRKDHTKTVIDPNLDNGVFVLTDRYRMSTDAYQTAQGMNPEKIMELQDHPHIRKADVTILLDTSTEEAEKRISKRGLALEKFEKNRDFTDKLVKQYRILADKGKKNPELYGKVIHIDGNKTLEEVEKDMIKAFSEHYEEWNNGAL